MFATMPPILRAIILMVIGMFFFMMGDLFLKLSSQLLPLGMVVMALGLGMSVLFALLMMRAGDLFLDRSYTHPAMIMRCIGESIGVIGVIIAVAYAPLSTVTAIMQSLPLVLTFMGAVFLKEAVGWRRVLALLAGLVGVLIIIRPGMDGFDAYASFTLVGVAGMAIRDFGTRIMPARISTFALSYYGSVMIFITGIGMMALSQDWQMPTGQASLYVAGLIITAAIGTLAVSTAMRLGDVSVISPFRYIRVVFGVGAGILILGEQVDSATYIGCSIVVGAGLYSWMRERKLAVADLPADPKDCT